MGENSIRTLAGKEGRLQNDEFYLLLGGNIIIPGHFIDLNK